MRVLGVNAVFHDPAAALVVDGDRPEERVAADIRRQVDQLLGLPA